MNKKIDSRRANSNNTGSSVQQFSQSPHYMQTNQIDQQISGRQSGSPTQNLNNIQKISARLRARNPAIMSMTTSPQMLLPLNQRSLSPDNYQQISSSQDKGVGSRNNSSGMMQPPQLSVGINSQNFPVNNNNFQSLKPGAVQKHAQQVNLQQSIGNNATPASRDYTHQRKIMHKSLNSTGVPQVSKNQTIDSSQLIQFDPRTNSNANQQKQVESRQPHAGLNMSAHLITQRSQGQQQDLSQVNIGGNSILANSDGNMRGLVQDSLNGGAAQGNISLNKKISGHRKRNAREKSYDLYNQKLQLPPMIKPGNDLNVVTPTGNNTSRAAGKQDRTYSLPSAGQVHQSMPMSPNLAINQISNSKNYNTQIVPQRQSINDVLKQQVQGTQQQARFTYQNIGMQHQPQLSSSPESPSQSNSMIKQNITKTSSQSGVVNLNSMKSFFNARGQGNRSMDKNNTSTPGIQQIATNEIQKPTIPPQSNQNSRSAAASQAIAQPAQMQAVFSPRNRVIGAAQNNQQNQQISTIRSSQQRQPSSNTGRLGQSNTINQPGQSQKPQISDHHSAQQNHLSSRKQNPHQSHEAPTHREDSIRGNSTGMSGAETASTGTIKSNLTSNIDDESKASGLSKSSSGSQNGDSNIQFVEVQTLLFGENPPVLNPKTIFLKNHEPTKASQKKCGHIKSYAANTNQGIIREYNEDRVSIILNILKPKSKANLNVEWPQICFFGVFDGHGGAACADYLRDNLHNFVVQNELFPQYPQEAICAGFKECEKNFLNLVEVAQSRAQHAMPGQQVGPERSGSCAAVVMIINDTAYVINVGDSRCIMSLDAGANIAVLSRDHKPDDDQERVRIQAAGGKIYRTQTFAKAATSPEEKDLYVQGPLRVFPGRLSVSRTFGDIEAKRTKYGGNQNVIVCEPEIKIFKLKDNFDFFMIGCDGIFERLDNKQCIDSIWDRIQDQINSKTYDNISPQSHINRQNKKYQNQQHRGQSQQQFHYDEHIAAAEGVEIVLREAAASRSLDNITVLILGLKNLKKSIKKLFDGQTMQQVRQQNLQEQRGVKHTYDQDFEYLEVNEQDLMIMSDAEVASANSHGPDASVTVETENKKKILAAQSSPLHNSKGQKLNQEHLNSSQIPRKAN